MNCAQIEGLLTRYALGDLDEATRAQVESHVSTCPDCRATLEELRPTVDLLRRALSSGSGTAPRLDATRRARILASYGQRRPAVTVLWPLLKAAALVVVLLGIVAVLLPTFSRVRLSSAGTAARARDASLLIAAKMYEEDNGRRPQTGSDLARHFDGSVSDEDVRRISGHAVLEYAPAAEGRARASGPATYDADKGSPAAGAARTPSPYHAGYKEDAAQSPRFEAPVLESTEGVLDTPSSPALVNGTIVMHSYGGKARAVAAPAKSESSLGRSPAQDKEKAITRLGGEVKKALGDDTYADSAGAAGTLDGRASTVGGRELTESESSEVRVAQPAETPAAMSRSPLVMKGLYASRTWGGRSAALSKTVLPKEQVALTEPVPVVVKAGEAAARDSLTVVNGGALALESGSRRSAAGSESHEVTALSSAPSSDNKGERKEKQIVGDLSGVKVPVERPLGGGNGTAVVTDRIEVDGPAPVAAMVPGAVSTVVSQERVDEIKKSGPAPVSALAQPVTPSRAQPPNTSENAESAVEIEYPPQVFNPIVESSQNAFSTFGIDVDTASFTLARRYLLQGRRPPEGAIRVEEFVNAFEYAYRPPERDTFAVYADRTRSPFRPSMDLLRVAVRGKVIGRDRMRPSMLTFVIDTSGSMNTPDRLDLIRKSLGMLVDHLGPQDTVSIVTFGSEARLVLDQAPASQPNAIRAAVNGLQTAGSTHLEGGLRLGYEVAARHFRSGAINRVLLLSDGVANLGAATAGEILAQVERNRKQGIYCSIFGFGQGNYNDAMLEALADKGDGVYRFIDSAAEARRAFVDDLAATLCVIARDVKIQVQFDPARVTRYRQVGYENRHLEKEQFRDDTVDAGEVGAGQSATALYEIEVAGNAAEPLGTVRLRWKDADTGAVQERAVPIKAGDRYASFDQAPVRFRLAAGVAEFADLLRRNPFTAGTTVRDVAGVIRPAALELNLDQQVQDLVRMVNAVRE